MLASGRRYDGLGSLEVRGRIDISQREPARVQACEGSAFDETRVESGYEALGTELAAIETRFERVEDSGAIDGANGNGAPGDAGQGRVGVGCEPIDERFQKLASDERQVTRDHENGRCVGGGERGMDSRQRAQTRSQIRLGGKASGLTDVVADDSDPIDERGHGTGDPDEHRSAPEKKRRFVAAHAAASPAGQDGAL